MVLTEKDLVNELRQHSNGVKSRLWISTPFIGSLSDIHKILGAAWKTKGVDVRVLTDAENGFIKKDTFAEFEQYGEVKTLASLHAKIFLIDDWCLLTSANLTGTAFSRRYEIGTIHQEFQPVEQLFEKWWKMAKPLKAVLSSPKNAHNDYQNGTSFSKKCNLPGYTNRQANNDNYKLTCDQYVDFIQFYKLNVTRVPALTKLKFTIYQEIDCFFNYLYHNHENTPTKNIQTPQSLTEAQKVKLLRKYHQYFTSYCDEEDQRWRVERTILIQGLLKKDSILNLTIDDVRIVLNSLHCLNSYGYNKPKITKENSLSTILENWNKLLHTGIIDSDKIESCVRNLKHFGYSSARELIGWYYPKNFPMVNKNSNCGMMFFGYSVK